MAKGCCLSAHLQAPVQHLVTASLQEAGIAPQVGVGVAEVSSVMVCVLASHPGVVFRETLPGFTAVVRLLLSAELESSIQTSLPCDFTPWTSHGV